MSTYEAIYTVVRQIPFGKVATYGQVADLANLPRRARLVGYALYRVDTIGSDVPWHRVINAKGEISQSPFRQGSDDLQQSLLEQEGVVFNASGKISLRDYQWYPDTNSDVKKTRTRAHPGWGLELEESEQGDQQT
ncbi:methyltransferase [filamentous cyanobacterium CCP1]|nr:methyltransferase [filamentous cyanobacterium CCP2]PSB61726.1 methyltransferase [filamentous cyanobacterium CCP1]